MLYHATIRTICLHIVLKESRMNRFKDDGKIINMKVERRMYVKFLIMVKLDSSQGICRCRLLNDSFKSFRSILDLE